MSRQSDHLTYHEYRPDIDGLRAIAVLSVVGFHAFPSNLPGGFIGVDVFFVISGFLISSIIFSNLEHGRFSIVEFYYRRIRRIFPALITVLLASLAFGWFALLADEYKQLGKHIAGGAGFVSNFILWGESGYFDQDAATKPLLHLWSLGIEEQFYIFWPLLLAFIWKRARNGLWVTVAIAGVSFIANLYFVSRVPVATFYSPGSRFWELMMGGVLAYIALHKPELNRQNRNIQSVIGFVLLAVGLVLLNKRQEFPGWLALLPTLGAVLTISAGPTAWLNKQILARKLLVWFGLISYPLYLWHWPLLSFAWILEGGSFSRKWSLIAVLVSIVLAWLTYRFIERPIRFGSSAAIKVTSLLTLGIALGTAGFVVFDTDGVKVRYAAQRPELKSGDIGHEEFIRYGKERFYPCTPSELQKKNPVWEAVGVCLQSKNEDHKDIALIGDSHAAHLFIGLAEAAPQKNIVLYPQERLPLIDNEEYKVFYKHVISNDSIKKVVLAAFWGRQLRAQDETRLKKTIDALTESNKVVYIADDVPNFSFSPKKCKYARSVTKNKCSERRSFFQSQKDRYQHILKGVAESNRSARLLHLADYLCEAQECFMARNGFLFYRDRDHLNINGSKYIAHRILDDNPDVIN